MDQVSKTASPSGGGKGAVLGLTVAVVVLVVIAGVGWGLYLTKKTTSSSAPTSTNTASLCIGDFGVSHPDAGAWAWMINNSSQKAMFQSYDPNKNVSFADFPGGSGAVTTAMETGKVQLGMLSADTAISDVAAGLPISIVATYRLSPIGDYVLVNPSSSITSFATLGATINSTGVTWAHSKPGSLDVVLCHILAGKYGWSTSKITPAYVGSFQSQDSAVLTGSANITTGAYFDAYLQVQNNTLRSIGDLNESWPGFVLVALNNYISSQPATLSAALKAIFDMNSQFQSNTAAETHFIQTYYGFSTSETAFYVSIMHWATNGTIYTQSVNAEISALESYAGMTSGEKSVLGNVTAYSTAFYSAVNAAAPTS